MSLILENISLADLPDFLSSPLPKHPALILISKRTIDAGLLIVYHSSKQLPRVRLIDYTAGLVETSSYPYVYFMDDDILFRELRGFGAFAHRLNISFEELYDTIRESSPW